MLIGKPIGLWHLSNQLLFGFACFFSSSKHIAYLRRAEYGHKVKRVTLKAMIVWGSLVMPYHHCTSPNSQGDLLDNMNTIKTGLPEAALQVALYCISLNQFLHFFSCCSASHT